MSQGAVGALPRCRVCFFRLLVGRLLLLVVKTKQTRKHLSSVDIKQTSAEPTLVVDVLIKLAAVYGPPECLARFSRTCQRERHVPEGEERSGGGGWLGRADGVGWAEGVKLGYS